MNRFGKLDNFFSKQILIQSYSSVLFSSEFSLRLRYSLQLRVTSPAYLEKDNDSLLPRLSFSCRHMYRKFVIYLFRSLLDGCYRSCTEVHCSEPRQNDVSLHHHHVIRIYRISHWFSPSVLLYLSEWRSLVNFAFGRRYDTHPRLPDPNEML